MLQEMSLRQPSLWNGGWSRIFAAPADSGGQGGAVFYAAGSGEIHGSAGFTSEEGYGGLNPDEWVTRCIVALFVFVLKAEMFFPCLGSSVCVRHSRPESGDLLSMCEQL